MTPATRRSKATRFAFLVIALVQCLAMATLPLTHRHPPFADDGTASVAEQTDGSARSAHGELCVICQALRHAHTVPPAGQELERACETVSPSGDRSLSAESSTHLTPFRSRAPPIRSA